MDRAILALKTQRRRIDDQRRKVRGRGAALGRLGPAWRNLPGTAPLLQFLLLIERDQGAAGKLVALRQRERALLVLRMKHLHEQQLDRLDAWLLNVEAMVGVSDPVQAAAACCNPRLPTSRRPTSACSWPTWSLPCSKTGSSMRWHRAAAS